MAELKPCPFCGSQEDVEFVGGGNKRQAYNKSCDRMPEMQLQDHW